MKTARRRIEGSAERVLDGSVQGRKLVNALLRRMDELWKFAVMSRRMIATMRALPAIMLLQNCGVISVCPISESIKGK